MENLLEACYEQAVVRNLLSSARAIIDGSHFHYCILFLSSTPQHISFAIKSTFKLGVKVNHRGYINTPTEPISLILTHVAMLYHLMFKSSTVLLLEIGAMDMLNNIQVKTL